MSMHSLRGLAGSLLLLSILSGCGGGGTRDEVARSSRDQFERHLESLDQQLEALAEESEGRSSALRAASLVQRQSGPVGRYRQVAGQRRVTQAERHAARRTRSLRREPGNRAHRLLRLIDWLLSHDDLRIV